MTASRSDLRIDDGSAPFLAVVGMSGRFPGAAGIEEFWTNLVKGTDSLTRFTAPGAAHVSAIGLLEDADAFDAEFFGFSPREALLLDPQHRVFLECAWEALEDAGYDPKACPGAVGVYAGSGQNSYRHELSAYRERLGPVTDWQLNLGCGPDFLTTRVAYKLGLRGPAVTVQTACSTSLVALHTAAQALLSGECDVALAGGVSIRYPAQPSEYVEGGIISADGYCRAFDARASGTVGSSAAGVVVLKRLAEAAASGDRIRAVVRGTAVNNDASAKIGYTAPGVEGQAEVIRAALSVAGVPAESITYVETHGTGTALGDPVEVAALTKAFRTSTDARQFCRIGSVKTNVGHTDAASGVVGFIKAALAVERGVIPPSLHFSSPNPEIEFDDSPFRVNTELMTWDPAEWPRRAGVSSFGIGGTNAHVVLEQAPNRSAPPATSASQLLVLSARSATELDTASARLAEHLRTPGVQALPDVAWTLQTGRHAFPYRRAVVGADHDSCARALASGAAGGTAFRSRTLTSPGPVSREPSVAFVFSGHGGQYAGMGGALYESHRVFREEVERCIALAGPGLGPAVRVAIRPRDSVETETARRQLAGMGVAQVAVFVLEYATAQLWRHWGVEPGAVAGHSLGAFAAACVAGVLSLQDTLRLVAARGSLMETLTGGAMLAVQCREPDVTPFLGTELDLAAVNGPEQCVLSGPQPAIQRLHGRLTEQGVDSRPLNIAAAAHSRAVEPVLAAFATEVERVECRPPAVPWVSDTTGTWVPMDAAPTTDFWVNHMRRTVRFGEVVSTLFSDPARALVEVGPGRTLTRIAVRHPQYTDGHAAVSSLPHVSDGACADETMLNAAGTLWSRGADLTWRHMQDGQERRRVGLPTYPFTRRRYAPGPAPAREQAGPSARGPRRSFQDPPAESAWGLPEPVERNGPAVDATATVVGHLAEAFGVLLGLEGVDPHENFFELGGDSLVALQLMRVIREDFGVGVTARQIFTAATPAALANVIASASDRTVDGSAADEGDSDPRAVARPRPEPEEHSLPHDDFNHRDAAHGSSGVSAVNGPTPGEPMGEAP
ncbi:type I polyketide synthase [Streptomyces sp. B3I8]|uniref:type I polyketide synthase n=1 Tax=Streptomyces sp. B3I8 TaxID=3042303 RepID=UPI00278A1116|nr:beta-ketoacyl synthase N-terminal-like domain-containing protein [Streptomyces sp. B3I8]MDQ0786684.1 phthiocerol/phenolphthiocerol synthesis type-I polyketide synthase E [Streptomyces sp. B3I8]